VKLANETSRLTEDKEPQEGGYSERLMALVLLQETSARDEVRILVRERGGAGDVEEGRDEEQFSCLTKQNRTGVKMFSEGPVYATDA